MIYMPGEQSAIERIPRMIAFNRESRTWWYTSTTIAAVNNLINEIVQSKTSIHAVWYLFTGDTQEVLFANVKTWRVWCGRPSAVARMFAQDCLKVNQQAYFWVITGNGRVWRSNQITEKGFLWLESKDKDWSVLPDGFFVDPDGLTQSITMEELRSIAKQDLAWIAQIDEFLFPQDYRPGDKHV